MSNTRIVMCYLFFVIIFFVKCEEVCNSEDGECFESIGEESITVTLWKNSDYTERFKETDYFSMDDWIYVLCELDEGSRFSIAYFKSVIANPVPRQMSRATLISPYGKQENLSYKGELSDFKIDEFDDDESKRGFHFRIESEVFDFRKHESQDIIHLEVRIVLNVFHRIHTPSVSSTVEKVFSMIISTSNDDNEESNIVNIYSADEYLEGFLTLAEDLGPHQFQITKDDTLASIFWYRYFHSAEKRIKKTTSRNYIAVNHILSQDDIGKKDRLTWTLRRNSEITSSFYPTSYDLTYRKDRNEFISHLSTDTKDQIWMLKPSGLSEGRGAKFVSKINNVLKIGEELIEDPKRIIDEHLIIEGKEKEYIAQKYISNPLLMDGHKIGIRQFWMIASINPLRVLLYDSGFCTFGSTKYKNKNFNDMTIHLTNYDRQPDSDKPEFIYVKQFNEYLLENGIIDESWYEETFRRQVRYILSEVSKCYNESIFSGISSGRDEILLNFALFGADFIMDDDHVLWLNEVQRSPSLRHTGKCLKSQFMPEMMVETLNIIQEIRKYGELHGGSTKDLKQLKSVKKYEWVINDAL